MFPIKNYSQKIPIPFEPGGFGTMRKFDIHCGIDLYCEENEPVYCMEDGIVVLIAPFTGSQAESPWWNDTYCLMIESDSGVINYGEIKPDESLTEGSSVKEGDYIGNVVRVLKKDKRFPMDMLHMELYTSGTKEPVWWKLGESQPKNLLDPYILLRLNRF